MTREEAELVEPGALIALVFDNGEIGHTYKVTHKVADGHFRCVSVASGREQCVWADAHSVLTPRIQAVHNATVAGYAHQNARGRYESSVKRFRENYAAQVSTDLKDAALQLPVNATLRYELFSDGERVSVRLSAAEFGKLMGLLGVDARVPDLAAFHVACAQQPELVELKEAADSLLAKLNEQIAALKQGEVIDDTRRS